MRKFVITLLLLAAPLLAQDYWIAAGAAVDYLDNPRPYAWVAMGVRLSDTNNYSFTSVDMTRDVATIRTGVGRLLASSGRWKLFGIADMGVGVSDESFKAAFGGGFALGYEIRGGVYASLGMRVIKLTDVRVRPVFGFGFGRVF